MKGKLLLLSTYDNEHSINMIASVLGEGNKKVGYIASSPDPDKVYFDMTNDVYRQLGQPFCQYLELEDNFNETVADDLFRCDAIHLSGGDTYRFLKYLKKRNLMERLKDYFLAGGVLIGVSAGAMILTPSIETASLCGDSNTVDLVDLSALALVDFCVVPHCNEKENEYPYGTLEPSSYYKIVQLADNEGILVA